MNDLIPKWIHENGVYRAALVEPGFHISGKIKVVESMAEYSEAEYFKLRLAKQDEIVLLDHYADAIF